MRLPVLFAIGSIVVALAARSPLAFAQENPTGSTIRLTSATEFVSENTSSNSNSQSNQHVAEQREAAPPIRQSDQSANQPVRSLAPPIVHTPVEPPSINRTRMPAGFYASPEARSTLNQLPGPAPVQSAPRLQANRRGGKPFQAVQMQPTVSPYLYLNAGSNASNQMTNYFAFVRPQMEQIEAGRQQQREIQQLRTQVQKMSVNGTGRPSSPDSNAAAHYMDTAQFYRGLQR
jgi:hypothetical protein